MRTKYRVGPSVAAGAPGVLALGLAFAVVAGEKAAMPRLNEQPAPLSRETKAATSFAPIIKKVAPSVVNIYSTRTIRTPAFRHPFFDDEWLRRFFGEPFGPGPRAPRPRKAQNLGSGVIVSADGYLLTANHVVEGADEVRVALADGGKEFTARIVGTDPPTDIAVLKVEARDLPAIAITDSDKLEVGDVVLAIGNPFEVGQTVTLGIVSAVGRGGFGITPYEDFIQTDAAINPGNSGGALVDAEGRLVGINTAIISRTGGNIGVGFAVPINMARRVMERILTDGRVRRGYLGVSLQQEITADLAREFQLPNQTGAMVAEVLPDTPAARAGLKEGDVIVEFNGKKVADRRSLQLLVSQTAPGTKVTLKILRSPAPDKPPVERTLTLTLADQPPDMFAGLRGRAAPEAEEAAGAALEGVQMSDLDAPTRRQFEIPAHVRGALVAEVDSDSNAAEAGLKPGDVIVEINRRPVRNTEEAAALAREAKGDRLLLRVWSKEGDRGATRYLTVDNTRRP